MPFLHQPLFNWLGTPNTPSRTRVHEFYRYEKCFAIVSPMSKKISNLSKMNVFYFLLFTQIGYHFAIQRIHWKPRNLRFFILVTFHLLSVIFFHVEREKLNDFLLAPQKTISCGHVGFAFIDMAEKVIYCCAYGFSVAKSCLEVWPPMWGPAP